MQVGLVVERGAQAREGLLPPRIAEVVEPGGGPGGRRERLGFEGDDRASVVAEARPRATIFSIQGLRGGAVQGTVGHGSATRKNGGMRTAPGRSPCGRAGRPAGRGRSEPPAQPASAAQPARPRVADRGAARAPHPDDRSWRWPGWYTTSATSCRAAPTRHMPSTAPTRCARLGGAGGRDRGPARGGQAVSRRGRGRLRRRTECRLGRLAAPAGRVPRCGGGRRVRPAAAGRRRGDAAAGTTTARPRGWWCGPLEWWVPRLHAIRIGPAEGIAGDNASSDIDSAFRPSVRTVPVDRAVDGACRPCLSTVPVDRACRPCLSTVPVDRACRPCLSTVRVDRACRSHSRVGVLPSHPRDCRRVDPPNRLAVDKRRRMVNTKGPVRCSKWWLARSNAVNVA